MLAYNCSPSFNWKRKMGENQAAAFQREIGAMGYKFQFITLAGFHSLNHGMFELARNYRERGMAAYSELQQAEFASEAHGYTATRHQREVGVSYFDAIATAASGGRSSTTAMAHSTEAAQFHAGAPAHGFDDNAPAHGFDDGVVHGHGWASSSDAKPCLEQRHVANAAEVRTPSCALHDDLMERNEIG
jgi:isocitrate lyase